MNYHLILTGSNILIYDTVIKLFIYSVIQSDYLVMTYAEKRLTPHAPVINDIIFKGSQKKEMCEILVDFDGKLTVNDKCIHISPNILELPEDSFNYRYWAVMGSMYKIIEDISPAYVTGYLLKNNMKKELDFFNRYSNQLSFALRITINAVREANQ